MATPFANQVAMYLSGSTYVGIDFTTGGYLTGSSSAVTCLNTLLGLFPAGNVTVFIDPSVGSIPGQITITQPSTSLIVAQVAADESNGSTVLLDQLTLGASGQSAKISNCRFEGLRFLEIDVTNYQQVQYTKFLYCHLTPTGATGAKGLIIGQGTGSNYDQYIDFVGLSIIDSTGTTAIEFAGTVTGTSHFFFDGLYFVAGQSNTSPSVIFQFDNGCYAGNVVVSNLQANFGSTSTGGSSIFKLVGGSGGATVIRSFFVGALYMENHAAGNTIVTLGSCSSNVTLNVYISNVTVSTNTNATTYIQNSNTSWPTDQDPQKVIFNSEAIQTTGTSLTLGVVKNQPNHFFFEIRGPSLTGQPVNPFGSGTNETSGVISPAGDVATFNAGPYTVCTRAAFLIWTGAVTATLSDPLSNVISTGNATGLRVPVGFKVSFSAAPTTLVVSFE
jgi:hypothetical protein